MKYKIIIGVLIIIIALSSVGSVGFGDEDTDGLKTEVSGYGLEYNSFEEYQDKEIGALFRELTDLDNKCKKACKKIGYSNGLRYSDSCDGKDVSSTKYDVRCCCLGERKPSFWSSAVTGAGKAAGKWLIADSGIDSSLPVVKNAACQAAVDKAHHGHGLIGVCTRSTECNYPAVDNREENPCTSQLGSCCAIDGNAMCNIQCQQNKYLGGRCIPFQVNKMASEFDSSAYIDMVSIGQQYCGSDMLGMRSAISIRQMCYCAGPDFGLMGKNPFIKELYSECIDRGGGSYHVAFTFMWGGVSARTATVSAEGARAQRFNIADIGEKLSHIGDVRTSFYEADVRGDGGAVTVSVQVSSSVNQYTSQKLYNKQFVVQCEKIAAAPGASEAAYDARLEQFGGYTGTEALEAAKTETGAAADPIAKIYCSKDRDGITDYRKFSAQDRASEEELKTWWESIDRSRITDNLKKLSAATTAKAIEDIVREIYPSGYYDVTSSMAAQPDALSDSCIVVLKEEQMVYGIEASPSTVAVTNKIGFIMGPAVIGSSPLFFTEIMGSEEMAPGKTIARSFDVVTAKAIWIDFNDGGWEFQKDEVVQMPSVIKPLFYKPSIEAKTNKLQPNTGQHIAVTGSLVEITGQVGNYNQMCYGGKSICADFTQKNCKVTLIDAKCPRFPEGYSVVAGKCGGFLGSSLGKMGVTAASVYLGGVVGGVANNFVGGTLGLGEAAGNVAQQAVENYVMRATAQNLHIAAPTSIYNLPQLSYKPTVHGDSRCEFWAGENPSNSPECKGYSMTNAWEKERGRLITMIGMEAFSGNSKGTCVAKKITETACKPIAKNPSGYSYCGNKVTVAFPADPSDPEASSMGIWPCMYYCAESEMAATGSRELLIEVEGSGKTIMNTRINTGENGEFSYKFLAPSDPGSYTIYMRSRIPPYSTYSRIPPYTAANINLLVQEPSRPEVKIIRSECEAEDETLNCRDTSYQCATGEKAIYKVKITNPKDNDIAHKETDFALELSSCTEGWICELRDRMLKVAEGGTEETLLSIEPAAAGIGSTGKAEVIIKDPVHGKKETTVSATYQYYSKQKPELSFSPASLSGVLDYSQSFAISVKNNDPAECNKDRFYIFSSVPAGWKLEMKKNGKSIDNIVVPAGSSGTVDARVTPKGAAASNEGLWFSVVRGTIDRVLSSVSDVTDIKVFADGRYIYFNEAGLLKKLSMGGQPEVIADSVLYFDADESTASFDAVTGEKSISLYEKEQLISKNIWAGGEGYFTATIGSYNMGPEEPAGFYINIRGRDAIDWPTGRQIFTRIGDSTWEWCWQGGYGFNHRTVKCSEWQNNGESWRACSGVDNKEDWVKLKITKQGSSYKMETWGDDCSDASGWIMFDLFAETDYPDSPYPRIAAEENKIVLTSHGNTWNFVALPNNPYKLPAAGDVEKACGPVKIAQYGGTGTCDGLANCRWVYTSKGAAERKLLNTGDIKIEAEGGASFAFHPSFGSAFDAANFYIDITNREAPDWPMGEFSLRNTRSGAWEWCWDGEEVTSCPDQLECIYSPQRNRLKIKISRITQDQYDVQAIMNDCTPAGGWVTFDVYGESQSSGKGSADEKLQPGVPYQIKTYKSCSIETIGEAYSLDGVRPTQLTANSAYFAGPSQAVEYNSIRGTCPKASPGSGPLFYNQLTKNWEFTTLLEPGKGYFIQTTGCQFRECAESDGGVNAEKGGSVRLASASAVVQTGEEYKADIRILSYSQSVILGQMINIRAEVANLGSITWTKDAFHLRTLAYLPNGAYIGDVNTEGMSFVSDVGPGETASMNLLISTGDGTELKEKGSYRIVVDMVHEGRMWFENGKELNIDLGDKSEILFQGTKEYKEYKDSCVNAQQLREHFCDGTESTGPKSIVKSCNDFCREKNAYAIGSCQEDQFGVGYCECTAKPVPDADVYYIYARTEGAATTYELAKMSGQKTTILATSLDNPADIAIGKDYVYWTEFNKGAIYKLPKAGGAVSIERAGLVNPVGMDYKGSLYYTELGIKAWNVDARGENYATPSADALEAMRSLMLVGDRTTKIKQNTNGGTLIFHAKSPDNAAVGVQVVKTNLVQNPGFELTNGGELKYWLDEGAEGSTYAITADGRNGKAVKLPSHSFSWGYKGIRNTENKLELQPGQKIYGELYYKSNGGSRLYFGIIYCDNSYEYFGYSYASTGGRWEKLSGTITVPAGKTCGYVRVFNWQGSTADVWVDDVYVEIEGQEAQTENIGSCALGTTWTRCSFNTPAGEIAIYPDSDSKTTIFIDDVRAEGVINGGFEETFGRVSGDSGALATGIGDPVDVAVDNGQAYFTSFDDAQGRIYKGTSVMASPVPGPTKLDVSGDNVYWIEGSGTIMSMKKDVLGAEGTLPFTLQGYMAPEIAAESDLIQGVVGKAVTFNLKITRPAAEPDYLSAPVSYAIKISGEPKWSITADKKSISLSRGESAVITLTVQSPATTEKGVYPVAITVSNKYVTAKKMLYYEVIVPEMGETIVSLEPGKITKPHGSAGTVRYAVTIKNSNPVSTMPLEFYAMAEYPEKWSAAVSKDKVTVAPQASETIYLDITPSKPEPGIYEVDALLVSEKPQAAEVISNTSGIQSINISGVLYLYYSDKGSIKRSYYTEGRPSRSDARSASGLVKETKTIVQANAKAFYVSGDYLFYIYDDGKTKEIRRIRNDGVGESVSVASGLDDPRDIAVYDYVYWTEYSKGKIMTTGQDWIGFKVTFDNAGRVYATATNPVAMYATDGQIYWSDSDGINNCETWKCRNYKRTLLAADVKDITVAGGAVYYTTYSGKGYGRVWKNSQLLTGGILSAPYVTVSDKIYFAYDGAVKSLGKNAFGAMGTARYEVTKLPAATGCGNAPALSAKDTQLSARPGDTLRYGLAIMNRDESKCDLRKFFITKEPPRAWTGILEGSGYTVDLGAGTSADVKLSVTSPSDAAIGVYKSIALVSTMLPKASPYYATGAVKDVAYHNGYMYYNEGGIIKRVKDEGLTSSARQLASKEVVVGNRAGSVGRFTVDSEYVYWIETYGTPVTKTIYKIKNDGTGDVMTVAGHLDDPRYVAVDSSNVYWTDKAAVKYVSKTSSCDGTACAIYAGASNPAGIYVSEKVYWIDSGRIKPADIEAEGAKDIYAEGNVLYYTTASQVWKYDSRYTALAVAQSGVDGIAADSSRLYWADSYGIQEINKSMVSDYQTLMYTIKGEEICDNGIDDEDPDTLVDYYDSKDCCRMDILDAAGKPVYALGSPLGDGKCHTECGGAVDAECNGALPGALSYCENCKLKAGFDKRVCGDSVLNVQKPYREVCEPGLAQAQWTCDGQICAGTKTKQRTGCAPGCAECSYGAPACAKGSCGAECETSADCSSGKVCIDCMCSEPSPVRCNGECDELTASGVKFSASVEGIYTPIIVACKGDSSKDSCLNDRNKNACGGGSCLCSGLLGCDYTCSDASGGYFIVVLDPFSGKAYQSASYQYQCPELHVAEIYDMRDDFDDVYANIGDIKAQFSLMLLKYQKESDEYRSYAQCISYTDKIISEIGKFKAMITKLKQRDITPATYGQMKEEKKKLQEIIYGTDAAPESGLMDTLQKECII